jgi:hypothetical protein
MNLKGQNWKNIWTNNSLGRKIFNPVGNKLNAIEIIWDTTTYPLINLISEAG